MSNDEAVGVLIEAWKLMVGRQAVMRQAIAQGQPAMGVTRMTLHASDRGRPVYRAMGFEPGARVMLLGAAEGSAGH